MEDIERRLRRSGDEEAILLLRRYVERSNARYARLVRRTIVSMSVLTLFLVASLVAQAIVIKGAANEAKTRRSQFCHLINSTYADQVKQYQGTLVYLDSDPGREPTGLNKYIREIALPQARQDVILGRRRIPAFCLNVDPRPADTEAQTGFDAKDAVQGG